MRSSRQFTIGRIMIWTAAIAVWLAISRAVRRESLLLFWAFVSCLLYLVYSSRGHFRLDCEIGLEPRRNPESTVEKLVPRRR
jgi:hypothetical protein